MGVETNFGKIYFLKNHLKFFWQNFPDFFLEIDHRNIARVVIMPAKHKGTDEFFLTFILISSLMAQKLYVKNDYKILKNCVLFQIVLVFLSFWICVKLCKVICAKAIHIRLANIKCGTINQQVSHSSKLSLAVAFST